MVHAIHDVRSPVTPDGVDVRVLLHTARGMHETWVDELTWLVLDAWRAVGLVEALGKVPVGVQFQHDTVLVDPHARVRVPGKGRAAVQARIGVEQPVVAQVYLASLDAPKHLPPAKIKIKYIYQ